MFKVAEGRVPMAIRRSTEPREYYALLQRDGVDVEVHRFWMPHWSKPGGRKAHYSRDMFVEREIRFFDDASAADPLKPHWWAYIEWIEECSWEISPDLPVFHHADLWETYKAIGYDIKKKRFVGKKMENTGNPFAYGNPEDAIKWMQALFLATRPKPQSE